MAVGLGVCLLFVGLLSLTACNNEATPQSAGTTSYSFTDSIGVSICLTQRPERVAVLFSSFADIWTTAGGRVAITVGESVERGFAAPDAVLVDQGAGKTVNTELLIAEQPDFVICSADLAKQVQAAKLLNQCGIPAACFRVESFDDYLQVLQICTDLTGCTDAYQTYGLEVRADIQSQLASLKEQAVRPRILFVRASSSSVKAKAAEDHFVAAMLTELGACNLADEMPLLLDGLNDEALVRADPEAIFVSVMGNEEGARAYLAQNVIWQSLTAVRQGHCFYLPKDLFQFKPNARWGEAYRYLIELLYEKT